MKNYLVVYALWLGEGQVSDHYEHFTSLRDAEKRYEEVLDIPTIYSASITEVIKSTDY